MTADPFAKYIRILGRGPTNSRHLTRAEAAVAFGGVLSGEMADLQVGALLLLLRYRGESPEELAGIVDAMRQHIGAPQRDESENLGENLTGNLIDWPSYSSGRSRRLPWFLLSAKLLSENGVKILMHGFNSHLTQGLLTEDCLAAVGESPAASLAAARQRLERENFVYLPLRNFCPELLSLLQIRSLLGVRSIVNTAVKLINPLAARMIFLGIFHPAYIRLNVAAGGLLGQPRLGVIKGGGGEAERNILKPIRLYQVSDGAEQVTSWPAAPGQGRERPDYPVTVDYMRDIWRGRLRDDYAAAMIQGTTAQALYLTGRAATVEQAEQMARDYWRQHLEKTG